MLFLWQLSLFISMVTLLLGIEKKSWLLLLMSTITFLPIAYYFAGANNIWKFVGITPIILLVLTIFMWFFGKKKWTSIVGKRKV